MRVGALPESVFLSNSILDLRRMLCSTEERKPAPSDNSGLRKDKRALEQDEPEDKVQSRQTKKVKFARQGSSNSQAPKFKGFPWNSLLRRGSLRSDQGCTLSKCMEDVLAAVRLRAVTVA